MVAGKPKQVIKCSSDPHHEPGLVLNHPSLPTCIVYNDDNLTAVKKDPDPNIAYTITFDKELGSSEKQDVFTSNRAIIELYIQKALDCWYKECNNENTSMDFFYNNPNIPVFDLETSKFCCLNVKWSDNPKEFEFEDSDGKTFQALMATSNRYKDNDCKTNCEDTHIRINNSESFAYDDEIGKLISFPTNFFYMRDIENSPITGIELGGVPDIFKNELNPNLYVKYYDFLGALKHEIGHWFGFRHESENEKCSFFNVYTPGVMGNALAPHTDINLSEDDACMFKKIYCCEQSFTGVEEIFQIYFNQFNLYPNPASEKIDISYNTKSNIKYQYRIVDENGIPLSKYSQTHVSQESSFSIDVSNYLNGVYFLELKFDDTKIGYKFIISR